MTLEQAQEAFDYDREKGQLVWKMHYQKRMLNKFKGKVAGTVNSHGYHLVCYQQARYRTASIIWLLETGEWPRLIKHIDGDKSNCRFSNLMTTGSKYHGVYKRKSGKWSSFIQVDGRQVHLGMHDTEDEAFNAHKLALIEASRR